MIHMKPKYFIKVSETRIKSQEIFNRILAKDSHDLCEIKCWGGFSFFHEMKSEKLLMNY